MTRLLASATAILAVATAAGCGGGEEAPSSAPRAAKPVGQERAGSVVQFANCGDWRKGTKAARMATVEALRRQLTPERSTTGEGPLPDARAYSLLHKTCSSGSYDSLRLYKLYVRMQGFAPLME